MIRIFGRHLFFKFRHIVYEYNVSTKNNIETPFVVEKVTNNVQDLDMGYFSIRMLKKVLSKNPHRSEAYIFREKNSMSIIGFVLITYKGAKEIHYKIKEADAFITALGIFPNFRGNGYSQSILEYANYICLINGYHKLKLVVDYNNYVAIKAYEKFGFIKICEKKFFRIMGIDFLLNKSV